MPKFQKKTLAVIAQLKEVLKTTKYYPTKGHFYREIELLKFPYLKDCKPGSYYYSSHGRNVYSQQQYDDIFIHCILQGWVNITRKDNRTYQVIVSQNIA
jgi:hypothetical protein